MNRCFLIRPLAWEIKRLFVEYATVFYFSYPLKNMKIVSKWNGRNYYGFESEDKPPVEIVRVRGYFYRTKYVIGEWLKPIGDALKKSEFNLVE